MWPVRIAGLVAVLGSLAACADDTDRNERTSESTSDLTAPGGSGDDPGGLGDDVPMPLPPGPWDDPNWRPSRASFDDRALDPVGPAHACALDYLKIYDPGRSRTIEVPIVRCD